MAKTQQIKFKDLELGQVYYLSNPVRVARVTGATDVLTRRDRKRDGVEDVGCVIVEVRLPTKPIEGHVSAKDAMQAKKFLEPGLKAEGVDQWREWWGERWVGPIVQDRRKGGIFVRLEEPEKMVKQLACIKEDGRNVDGSERLERTSPVIHKAIEGALVDETCWPGKKAKPVEVA